MPTVLVVDDSEVDRRLIAGLVEKDFDVKLIYAKNGKDALQKIERDRPDVVLTDLQMPEMDGLELVSAVKIEYPRIPVVLITSKGSEEVAAEALRMGASSYVPKKLLADHLIMTLDRVLVGARQDRTHSHLMHHMTESESAFTFHNDLGLIQALVKHLQELVRCLPLGDEIERLRVGIAVEEALRNAYYHGNLEVGANGESPDYGELAAKRRLEPPYCERKIHVRAKISRDNATFIIRDEGPGFDTSQLPESLDLEDQDHPGGRGFRLMKSVMDEVIFNETGNEVTLVKRSTGGPAEELEEDDQVEDEA